MVNGAHFLLYSKDPDADRAFFKDVLQFRSVDAGHGWLIFALPPAELAIHPGGSDSPGAELYLMCADLTEVVKKLKAKGWGKEPASAYPAAGSVGCISPRIPPHSA